MIVQNELKNIIDDNIINKNEYIIKKTFIDKVYSAVEKLIQNK